MRRRRTGWIACLAVLSLARVASADPHEVQVPLHDGRLSMPELLSHVRLPGAFARHLPKGGIDLRSFGGSLFITALDQALGDGCRVQVTPDALVLHVDADKLPGDVDGVKKATRTFTAVAAPEATAAQAKRFGLALPKSVDGTRPLVVVIHGLDMTAADMAGIDKRLAASGYQSADFDYPADGPIADDVSLLARHLSAVHETYPGLKVDVVAFSMGGLIARGYVEGANYAGGVDRLIMIATPNHGSKWASLEVVPKVWMTVGQMSSDAAWRPTWFITSGLGEAGRDLKPGSKFLVDLDRRDRCASVRYTIVEGDQTPSARIAAAVVDAPTKWVPSFARDWWGVKQARAGLASAAADLRRTPTNSDGPVSLDSAALAGVTDVVTVHADHSTIYRGSGDQPPAAWAILRDRLATP